LARSLFPKAMNILAVKVKSRLIGVWLECKRGDLRVVSKKWSP